MPSGYPKAPHHSSSCNQTAIAIMREGARRRGNHHHHPPDRARRRLELSLDLPGHDQERDDLPYPLPHGQRSGRCASPAPSFSAKGEALLLRSLPMDHAGSEGGCRGDGGRPRTLLVVHKSGTIHTVIYFIMWTLGVRAGISSTTYVKYLTQSLPCFFTKLSSPTCAFAGYFFINSNTRTHFCCIDLRRELGYAIWSSGPSYMLCCHGRLQLASAFCSIKP